MSANEAIDDGGHESDDGGSNLEVSGCHSIDQSGMQPFYEQRDETTAAAQDLKNMTRINDR